MAIAKFKCSTCGECMFYRMLDNEGRCLRHPPIMTTQYAAVYPPVRCDNPACYEAVPIPKAQVKK